MVSIDNDELGARSEIERLEAEYAKRTNPYLSPVLRVCAVLCLVGSAALALLLRDSLAAHIAGWALAGLGAITCASFAVRLQTGRRRIRLGALVAVNVIAVALALWHATFVTRRFW